MSKNQLDVIKSRHLTQPAPQPTVTNANINEMTDFVYWAAKDRNDLISELERTYALLTEIESIAADFAEWNPTFAKLQQLAKEGLHGPRS